MRVVEVSAFVAAPLAGSTLASAGADVIRVDPIAGPIDGQRWPLGSDGRSLYWAGLNAGKRSILMNLRSDEGRELLSHLVVDDSEAGILLTNNPAMDWASHANLEKRRSDIITCLILGHPSGMRAVDYTVNSAVGIPMLTGIDGPPVNSVIPTWDITTGLTAALRIMMAVNRRQATGEGTEIRLSLFETALGTLESLGMLGEVRDSGVGRPRIGNHLYGAFGRDFQTADGCRIMVTAISPNQMRNLLGLVGYAIPETDDLAGYAYEHRQAVTEKVQAWVGQRSLADASEQLDKAGALVGPYQTIEELVEGRGMWSAGPPAESPPAPGLGQHTDELLATRFGFSDLEIGRLRDDGIVA